MDSEREFLRKERRYDAWIEKKRGKKKIERRKEREKEGREGRARRICRDICTFAPLEEVYARDR